jgi:thioredoxin-like negative regulator of GroEL
VTTLLQQVSSAARRAAQAEDWVRVRSGARQILDRDRNSAEGRFLLGLAEKGAGRTQQAIAAFSRAVELDRNRYDAAIELADQYLHQHRYGEAASLLQDYESLLENSPLYLDLAGTIYTKIGLPERGWPLYRKADELQPGVDSIRANLAACSVFVGRIDEARELYRDLLARHPNHQRNHYELSRLGRATDDSHIEQMKTVLQATRLPPAQNIYLYYALGKELEDLGRWDEAFEYYKKAGDAARSVADYDVQNDIRMIDAVVDTCTADWLAGADSTVQPHASRTPIFVVGLPRSGTTLTERILSCHSLVESIGESFFVQIAIKSAGGLRVAEDMSPAIIRSAAKKDVARIATGYQEAIAYRLHDKPYFIEKLPENMLYLGFLAKAFPGCKIVVLKRDAMDACFALYKQSFFRYAYSLDDLGHYYVAYHKLYEHWRRALGDRMIEVSYESLVREQERETKQLLERLGLSFEEACLRFDENARASNTASAVQIREKIHTRSVGRWRKFETQLQPLREFLVAAGIEIH